MVSQFSKVQTVDIQGTSLTVAQVTAIARRSEVKVNLDEAAARERVAKSANWVAENIFRGIDTYGVTTGFGATSHRRTSKTTDLQTELIRFLNDTTGHVEREREREREREQVDRPEIDWTQCLSPRGTPDDPMTKMQTSTEQKQQSARGKMRLHSTANKYGIN
jgi:hypothetical protein